MTYKEQLIEAIHRSDEWKVAVANDFEPTPTGKNTVGDYTEVAHRFFSKGTPISEIRLQCSEVHFALWEAMQRAGLQSFVTIGEVYSSTDEDPYFGATIENLKAEWNRQNYLSSNDTRFHVWLTLPDMETIVDATIIPFSLGNSEELFDPKSHIYISDKHNGEIHHSPLLIGITFLFQSGAVPRPYQVF